MNTLPRIAALLSAFALVTCADAKPALVGAKAAPVSTGMIDLGHSAHGQRLVGLPVAQERGESDGWPPLRLRIANATALASDPIVVDGAIARSGRLVAAVTPDGRLLVGKPGGDARVVVRGAHPGLAFSPNGRRVAFACGRLAPELDVCVSDLASGLTTRLTTFDGPDDRPAFSADGRTVFFVSGRSGIASIWSAPVDGSARPAQVTNRGLTSVRGALPVPMGPAAAVHDGTALTFDTGSETVRIGVTP